MKNIIYTFVTALVMTIIIQGYSDKVNDELQNNVVRLHILANSDSDADQSIKLKVRDEILKKVSLQDKEFLKKTETVANDVLGDYVYKAKAEYGKFYFPMKKYNGITLPCGNYYGVRIVLGEGRGQNWWCVLYPPMCVQDDTITMNKCSQEKLKDVISQDTYEIITQSNDEIVVKFKIVEVFNKIKNLIDNF